jgi:hypothetical protein
MTTVNNIKGIKPGIQNISGIMGHSLSITLPYEIIHPSSQVLSNGTSTWRIEARDGSLCWDYTITALGFDGVEDTDWYNAESVDYPWETELETYILGLATPLSVNQKINLNTFIRETKSALSVNSLSAAFDLLYILAGETQESSLKNLAQDTFHATLVSTPAFVAYQGFTGATGKYIKTGFLPATHLSAASLNSLSHGAYIRQAVDINAIKIAYGTYNAAPSATQIYNMPNYASKNSEASNDGLGTDINYKQGFGGFYCGIRSASNVTRSYINYLKGDGTRTSVALPTKEVYILARNLDGVVNSILDKEVSLMFLGKALTETQMYAFMAAFEKYMDANGKGFLQESIAVIGDSISDIYTTITAWPCNFLQSQYTQTNYASSGGSITLGMQAAVAKLTGDVFDKIIIGYGTNDDNAGNMTTLQASAETYLSTLKTNNPSAQIFWRNVLPRWTDVGGGTEVAKGNVRAAIAAACVAQGVTCWDSYTTPWIVPSDTVEGLHPTADGAIKIYNEVLSRI